MTRALEIAVAVFGVVFVTGVAVGILIMVTIPRLPALWPSKARSTQQPPSEWGTTDTLGTGAPGSEVPPGSARSEEPDDRGDYRWWANGR
jgi:hypothetical protein